ncbi:MAG TPA: hypothetical protein VEA19_02235 [Actinomycetota bacterium]|nr:hypothetical protein [Actinomycetota bacterium]
MLANLELAELLARASAQEDAPHRQRALRRASRHALMWPEEAHAVLEGGRSLTELRAVGPWVARILEGWMEAPPELPEPPALRSGFLSFAHALEVVRANPDWVVRGDHQVHSTWSDGSLPVRGMVDQAAPYGYDRIAITDHSKGLPIARGMPEEKLARQAREIASVNADLEAEGASIRVLHAIEMNLSPLGEGDMDPEALWNLDLVLGAFHSKLRTKEDQTERYVAALRNPDINVLAHPRGRRWDHRLGLGADWGRVFAEAAEQGVALEIDAYPDRQDLNVELLEVARESGCWISMGTDAHADWELQFMPMAVAAAILARVPRDRVLNLLPREQLVLWARQARDRRRGGGVG